jgi:dTDP-4-amino-4,6-dideoxygalactose transaminase
MYHDVGSYIRDNRDSIEEPLLVGVNCRMPELSAAILRPQLERLDRKLERLRTHRNVALEHLQRGRGFRFRISPHHDADAATGLAVHFDDADEARAFAATVRGTKRVIDTGRHVYTNWESVLARRPVHPKLDPYAWAHRPVRITPECCPRTLDVLARTCAIELRPDLPTAVYRALAMRFSR